MVKVKVMGKVKIRFMVKVMVMDIVLETQIRFPKNLVKIRQAGAWAGTEKVPLTLRKVPLTHFLCLANKEQRGSGGF